jgi:hypothetical protein
VLGRRTWFAIHKVLLVARRACELAESCSKILAAALPSALLNEPTDLITDPSYLNGIRPSADV